MNKADQKRVQRFEKVGCIACRLDERANPNYDVHHLVRGYRIGDHATIPLCPWHHRGVCEGSPEAFKAEYGPSMKWHKKEFDRQYGSQQKLLELTNELAGV